MSHNKPVCYHLDSYKRTKDSRFANPSIEYESRQVELNSSLRDVKITTNNPGWKVKIAQKQDASAPYTRIQTDIYPRDSFVRTTNVAIGDYRIDSYFTNGVTTIPTFFLQSIDESLKGRALERLKNKIRAQSDSMNILVPIGELKDLRGMIRTMADLTSDLAKKLIEIKRTKGRSAVKLAKKAWLSWSFGIKPMMSEAENIAHAIATFLERTDSNVVISASASSTWETKNNNATPQPAAYGNVMYHDCTIVHTLRYQWTGGFHFPVSAANNYDIFDQFNVNFPALIPVAWELIPFSWVVDYFVNVGTFLDDLFTSTPGSSIYLTCSRTYHAIGYQSVRFVKNADEMPLAFVLQDVGKYGVSTWQHSEFQREAFASLPHTSLRFKSVDEIGMNSINKLLNLLAVAS